MSGCHGSCASCSSNLFTSCLSCPDPVNESIINGACICDTNWDSTCMNDALMQRVFQSFDMIYILFFVAVLLLYSFKVKLPYSYRIISGLQSFSFLIFSNFIYLSFQDYYGLKTLSKSNGFYYLTNRLDSLSFSFVVPTMVFFTCYLFGIFLMYYPTQVFIKKYDGFCSYFKDNAYQYLAAFYYFGSRMMFYFIGKWVSVISTDVISLVFLSLYGVIILLVIVKSIYDFHKQCIDQSIFESQLYLYCMLSPAAMIGLPLVASNIYATIIYASPIGLLLLILLFNRNYEVFTIKKVLFYVIELLMAGMPIAFILLGDTPQTYILLATIFLSILLITIEACLLYYSGVSLEKSSKVYPEQEENYVQNINQKKKPFKNVESANYF